MQNLFCPECALSQPVSHLYCVRCGTRLPTELLTKRPPKTVHWSPALRVADGDTDAEFLRVSCYLRDQQIPSPEGLIHLPGRHVRFSVWSGDRARCAISLSDTEALALAEFIEKELTAQTYAEQSSAS